jgi:DNA-binding transcriptional regulator YiaG
MSVSDLANLEPLPEIPPVPHRKHMRRRFQVKQETLARQLGVSIRTLWRWENGLVEPNHPAYREYCRILNSWQTQERNNREGLHNEH